MVAGLLLVVGGLAVYAFLPRGGVSAPVTPPAAGRTNTPAPVATAPTRAPLVASTARPLAGSVSGRAGLQIALDHSLGNGSIRIWVDDDVALERPIYGRVIRKVLNFKVYKGTFRETLGVSPGERVIRVEVLADTYSDSKRIRGDFANGTTRLLRAEVTAWPKRELRLSWGS
jgi:hypothetical protein